MTPDEVRDEFDAAATAAELDEVGVGVHPYTGSLFHCVDLVHHNFKRVPATRLVSAEGTWSGPAACDDDDHLGVATLTAIHRFLRGDDHCPIDEAVNGD
jgi:hypothetical protein